MASTTDHTEMPELKKVLGLDSSDVTAQDKPTPTSAAPAPQPAETALA